MNKKENPNFEPLPYGKYRCKICGYVYRTKRNICTNCDLNEDKDNFKVTVKNGKVCMTGCNLHVNIRKEN